MTDIWDSAKGVLATVAPSLATAMGGPLAGMAAKAIAGAVLGDGAADEKTAAEAVRNATPDQLRALKKADAVFAVEMKKLDVDLSRIAASDRDSARKRQIAAKDRTPAIIAGAVIAGFFGILAAMIFVDIPPGAAQPLAVMLGALGTLVTQIGAFFYGSSAGSSKKNEMLAGLLQRPR